MSGAKNVEIAMVDLTRTRAHEKIRMKHNVGESHFATLLSIFQLKRKAFHESRIFNESDLIDNCLIMQLACHSITWFLSMALFNGGTITTVMHCIGVILCGVPLFMLTIFMGIYSKRGIIKLWECVPLFKGIGYAVVFTEIAAQLFNAKRAGECLLLIYNMFSHTVPWTDCNYTGAVQNCIPMNPENATTLCVGAVTSSIGYYRYHINNWYSTSDVSDIGPIKLDLAISVWVVWILLYISAAVNFRIVSTTFLKIYRIVFIYFVILFIITCIISYNFEQRLVMYKGISHLFCSGRWIEMIIFVIEGSAPGTILYLASITRSATEPVIVTLKVYFFKMMILIAVLIWCSVSLSISFSIYKMWDCPNARGTDIMFAVIPDVITLLPLPQLWLILWYFSIFILNFAPASYTLTASTNSLVQLIPHKSKWKTRVACLLSVICASLSLMLTTRLSATFTASWAVDAAPYMLLIISMLYILSCVLFYRIKTILIDYEFSYNKKLSNYWVISWKVLPLVLLFTGLVLSQDHIMVLYLERPRIVKSAMFGTCAVAILLVLLTMLLLVLRNFRKKLDQSALFQPHPKWGPLDEKKRKARRRFNPEREIGYQVQQLNCIHNCLRSSVQYTREVFSQRAQYKSLEERMAEWEQQKAKKSKI